MRLADNVAAMQDGGTIHHRHHQTPIPDPVSSQGLHPDQQQTLCHREFSASPLVSTFLSTVSQYKASIRHVSRSAIPPLDFASRNAALCEDKACQVCTFTKLAQDSVIRYKTLSGDKRLPFTSCTAWSAKRAECADLWHTLHTYNKGYAPPKNSPM